MAITWGEAKRLVAQFAGRGGKCDTDPEVPLFLRQVLDYMLHSGQYGNLRKFNFTAVRGIFTAPYELEAPLKARINGEVTSVYDRWFEYNFSYGDLGDCIHAHAIFEEPNYAATVYDVPVPSAFVAAIATCEESSNAGLIVKGYDSTGREIVTVHNGEQIVGCYLTIQKGQKNVTPVRFARITEVIKSSTNGYVQLVWLKPETPEEGFLADYSPLETKPQYRRFRLQTVCGPIASVSILGRIRLKSAYADNDLIPFDNLYTLSLAGQAINSNYNNDVQNSALKDQMLQSLIQRENDIKKVQTGSPIDVYIPLAGGSIKNIVF